MSPNSFRAPTQLYLGLLCSLFLLFPGFGGYSSITRGKFLLLAALTFGYLLFLPRPGQFSLQSLRAGGNAPQILVLCYLLWSALSTLFSLSPALSFWGSARREGLVTLLLYGAVFFAVELAADSYVKRAEQIVQYYIGID